MGSRHDDGDLGPDRTLPYRGATSRLSGVPVDIDSLGVAVAPVRQMALLDGLEARRPTTEVLPGVVHVPDWLTDEEQRALVEEFRQWARPPAGLRHPRMPTGQVMSTMAVCLGWHWWPYAYSRHADDTDGAPVTPLPASVDALARRAVSDTYGPDSTELRTFEPDAGIVNLYPPDARLGLHQDGEEPSSAPVITISLGDACTFRMAGIDRRTGPFTDVELRSGDLLVFGRENRRIFHGVPKVVAGTAPDGLGLPPGRLSITVRQTGFA